VRTLFAVIFLFVALVLCHTSSATTTTCTTGALPNGDGGDLIVSTGTCTVKAGTYQYHNVNIISGGTLLFTDTQIDFWAESILVENTGSLIAGSTAAPIGANGGKVTFHLYGKDQGTGKNGAKGPGVGITCLSDPLNPCGVPKALWNSNSTMDLNPTSCVLAKNVSGYNQNLPGNVDDCFYRYEPLDYDDGASGSPPTVGYFGYKVVAVSYGGRLQED